MKSNNMTVFFGAIVVAIVGIILAVYYALPGVYHVLVSGKVPATQPQPSHILLFAVIAILGIVAALVTRPKAAR